MKLFVVIHPDLDKGFILSSEIKAKNMIDKNEKVWEKYNMDPKYFKIESWYVKDAALVSTIKDGMPELFL